MERPDRRFVIAAQYVAAVRERLADLPPGEVTEIIGDVREHLEQVASEYDDTMTMPALTDRLGTPEQYADDLRASAGLPPPGPAPERPGFARRLLRFMAAVFGWSALGLAVAALFDTLFVTYRPSAFAPAAAVCAVAAVATVLLLVLRRPDPRAEMLKIPGANLLAEGMWWLRNKPWGPPAIDFVRSLRPAWWALRAALLGLIVAYMTTIPMGAVAFLAALVASVWLGNKSVAGQVSRRGAFSVYGANVGLAVSGLVLGTAVAGDLTASYVDYVPYGEEEMYGDPYGYVRDTYPVDELVTVTNIYPYGPDGALLYDVRLFDQDGRPIEVSPDAWCDGSEGIPGESGAMLNPWGGHVYPRLSAGVDEFGECLAPELRPPYGTHLPEAGAPTAAMEPGASGPS